MRRETVPLLSAAGQLATRAAGQPCAARWFVFENPAV